MIKIRSTAVADIFIQGRNFIHWES